MRRYCMTIQYEDLLDPVKGVSLLRSICIPHAKPFHVDEITLLQGKSSPVDKHKVAELWLILAGKGDLFHQGKTHSLKSGDWFFFKPYEEHQILNKGQGNLRILSIYWGENSSF